MLPIEVIIDQSFPYLVTAAGGAMAWELSKLAKRSSESKEHTWLVFETLEEAGSAAQKVWDHLNSMFDSSPKEVEFYVSWNPLAWHEITDRKSPRPVKINVRVPNSMLKEMTKEEAVKKFRSEIGKGVK